jgi:hypothetical protein
MKITHSLNPKPEHSVGDIFHRYGDTYDNAHAMSPEQCKVLRTLSKCRTSALGGHLYECDEGCGYEIPVYNSCRDRHCPLCQGIAMRKWLAKRMEELLPVPYYHTIFTISHGFDVLIPYNERLFYDALFEAASWSLDFMSRKYHNGTFGTTAVLHTWGQKLQRHVHLHCLVTGGALSLDRKSWIPIGEKYLVDVKELAVKFRDRFCHIIRRSFRKDLLTFKHDATYLSRGQAFDSFMEEQEAKLWHVYCQRPFAGPEKVVEYLGRYSHRVAISNRRILSVENGQVSFSYKDYQDEDAQKKPKVKTAIYTLEKFIQCFLLHVLPKGFRKIRYFGCLAGNNGPQKLALCRALIRAHPSMPTSPAAETDTEPTTFEPAVCPDCGGRLVVKRVLERQRAGPKRSKAHRKVA